MAPPADVRLAVRSRLVANGQVDDLHVESCCAEQQVEVAERIELAEVGAAVRDPLYAVRSSTFVPQSVSLTCWPMIAFESSENTLFPTMFANRIAPGSTS